MRTGKFGLGLLIVALIVGLVASADAQTLLPTLDSAAQIKSLFESRAVPRGAPGKDNVCGSGRLDLEAPPPEFSFDRLTEDTWRYFGWASTNHLPWSWKSTEVAGGDYANSAEIGLYMLAYLGAHALGSPWSPSASDTRAEIKATLDQLEAWQTGSQPQQPHGPNAYNNSAFFQWYWISWVPPVVGSDCPGCDNQYVPSVDNAWLALSLIATREYAQAEGWLDVAETADNILSRMDFRIWYDSATHLFSHGGKWNDATEQWEQYDSGSGTMTRAPDWDYYSNEGRIINFVARALGQLSDQEFADSLSALVQDPATYDRGTPDPLDDITVGKVNWDGSYFTYLAPALFIYERNTPYGEDTLDRATEAQMAYAEDKGYTYWGISDCFAPSGAYAKRGAPPCANCDPDDGLITPHASAFALNTSLGSDVFSNLQGLSGCGGGYSDDYGFKDSVYWDCSDVADRFCTLDQAWILLSLVNREKSTIWKYLYRDLGVITAHKEMYPIEDDSDNDGFIGSVEFYIGTDPLDDCPDVLGTPGLCPGPSCDGDDAWPPDLDVDREADIVDVLKFKPYIMTSVPPSPRRFDFDADGDIDIVDVMQYKPVIMTQCTNPPTLSVHFIDVGQGDAILIESSDVTILVDGGEASANVENYLQAQAVDDIDLMVATHPHADHIGGLIDVLALYDVHEIWTNGETHTSQTYEDFAAAVAAESATERDVSRGYSTQMNGLEIDVLHPTSPLSGDLNEDSVVLQVSCGEVDVLLTGDATTDSEASMQAAGVLSDVEVLKIGHHGSNTSTGDAFLTAVTPEDAVISVGAGNPYGHPHQDTLDRLSAAGVTVYRTDLDGTVVLTSDCATYSLEATGS